jgi:hypothetical protein
LVEVFRRQAELTEGHTLLLQAVSDCAAVGTISPSQLIHGLTCPVLRSKLHGLGSGEPALELTWQTSLGELSRNGCV